MTIPSSRLGRFLILLGIGLCTAFMPASAQPIDDTLVQMRGMAQWLASDSHRSAWAEHALTYPERFQLAGFTEERRTRYFESYAAASELKAHEIVTQIDSLQTLIAARQDRPPPTYMSGLRHDYALLRRAMDTDDLFERGVLIEAAHGDIETRRIHLASAPSRYQVELSVTTKQRGRVVNGYQVGLVPMLMSGGAPLFLLHTQSSPARGDVMPGRYELVVSLGGAEVARGPYRIGLSGESSEAIDVSVP